jgi:hypothetical protein
MTTEIDNPDYWFERAKESREIAQRILNQDMKDILEKIAKGYERVADQVRHGSINSQDN